MILDASVVVAALNVDDAHHRRAVDVFVETAGQRLLICDLTLAESLVAHVRHGTERQALARLQQLGVTTLPLVRDAVALARVRVETGLRMPDCIVLLTAEQEMDSLTTFDERLARVARSRGVTVLPAPDSGAS